MNGIPAKKINSRPQNWISLIKFVENRSKQKVRLPYCNLYAYGANNPIHYTDPDGRTNVAITSTYKMNSTTNGLLDYIQRIKGTTGPINKNRIADAGCAITAIANLASMLGFDYTPATVNSGNLVSDGDVQWKKAADTFGLSFSSGEVPFTYAMFDEQENDSQHNYYTIIRVQYDTNPDEDHHWVGVNGKETVDGIDYFVISPTSVNDSNITSTSLRGIQGWKKNSNNEILVPVNKVKEYRVFSEAVSE